MSETTGISWTDHTFNPWWGCSKVSPACDHCYAERDAKRFAAGRVLWGVGADRRTFGDAHWQAPFRWASRPFFQCAECNWRGDRVGSVDLAGGAVMHVCPSCAGDIAPARRRVFCASMGDWLDLDAPLDEFVRLLDSIRRTPELDWLLLSKRIGNWRKRLQEAATHRLATVLADGGTVERDGLWQWVKTWLDGKPPASVWVGSTVIDQAEADRDIPKLLAVPARVRFLSIEPMLSAIDLSVVLNVSQYDDGSAWSPRNLRSHDTGIGWVIAGGESGPHARPFVLGHAKDIVRQCRAAGVAVHVKQIGAHPVNREGEPHPITDRAGRDPAEWPEELRVQEFPS